MTFETERLILRPWEETDAAELYKYAKDERVGPPAGWPAHTSVENSLEIIRTILSEPETYAIILKETGLPIGSIGLMRNSDLAKRGDECELGYWLGVPYWGRGIMPEAARELIRYAFEVLKVNRIWCGYSDGNEKSKRVQEKLGFKYQWTSENVPFPQVGETRKAHANLLTREDYYNASEEKDYDKIKPEK
jgi:RimJ/RimL family protein N-acetyltransferase